MYGNTLAKLANGINDTPVTLAAKSHIRNGGAVLLAVSTNDALGAAAANIGRLLNTKHIYFVPMRQDDHIKKPNSIVADFQKLTMQPLPRSRACSLNLCCLLRPRFDIWERTSYSVTPENFGVI